MYLKWKKTLQLKLQKFLFIGFTRMTLIELKFANSTSSISSMSTFARILPKMVMQSYENSGLNFLMFATSTFSIIPKSINQTWAKSSANVCWYCARYQQSIPSSSVFIARQISDFSGLYAGSTQFRPYSFNSPNRVANTWTSFVNTQQIWPFSRLLFSTIVKSKFIPSMLLWRISSMKYFFPIRFKNFDVIDSAFATN